MKKVFDGKGVHDLIFDEHPYKVYKAKVTGTPTLKFIPFDIDGKEIFRGEGTVNFTCYEPFAFLNREANEEKKADTNSVIKVGKEYSLGADLWLESGEYLLSIDEKTNQSWGVTTQDGAKIISVQKEGKYVLNLNETTRILSIETEQSCSETEIKLQRIIDNGIRAINGVVFAHPGTYSCTDENGAQYNFSFRSGRTEYESTNNKLVLDTTIVVDSVAFGAEYKPTMVINEEGSINTETIAMCNGNELLASNKQCVNGYSLYDYPTRDEWALTSNIPIMVFEDGYNYGDEPASFIITKKEVNKGDEIRFYSPNDLAPLGKAIIIEEDCSDFEWNSETGMVSGVVKEGRRAINFRGNSRLFIPAGEDWSGYFDVIKGQGYSITQITKFH